MTASNPETLPHFRGTIYEGNLISSVMIEQTIIQAALSSIEMFYGRKSNCQAWIDSIENTAKILGQYTICIAFSKLKGSLVSTANGLKI